MPLVAGRHVVGCVTPCAPSVGSAGFRTCCIADFQVGRAGSDRGASGFGNPRYSKLGSLSHMNTFQLGREMLELVRSRPGFVEKLRELLVRHAALAQVIIRQERAELREFVQQQELMPANVHEPRGFDLLRRRTGDALARRNETQHGIVLGISPWGGERPGCRRGRHPAARSLTRMFFDAWGGGPAAAGLETRFYGGQDVGRVALRCACCRFQLPPRHPTSVTRRCRLRSTGRLSRPTVGIESDHAGGSWGVFTGAQRPNSRMSLLRPAPSLFADGYRRANGA